MQYNKVNDIVFTAAAQWFAALLVKLFAQELFALFLFLFFLSVCFLAVSLYFCIAATWRIQDEYYCNLQKKVLYLSSIISGRSLLV